MQNNKVGSIIRRVSLDRKMTQKQLAEKMNISDKAISKLGLRFSSSIPAGIWVHVFPKEDTEC